VLEAGDTAFLEGDFEGKLDGVGERRMSGAGGDDLLEDVGVLCFPGDGGGDPDVVLVFTCQL